MLVGLNNNNDAIITFDFNLYCSMKLKRKFHHLKNSPQSYVHMFKEGNFPQFSGNL